MIVKDNLVISGWEADNGIVISFSSIGLFERWEIYEMGNPSHMYFDEVTMKYSRCDTGRYVLRNIVYEDGVIVKTGQQEVE
ncbi:MAG: hypothetical protein QXT45_05715 [Candidatus Bilamarchaeaceae archaeon]